MPTYCWSGPAIILLHMFSRIKEKQVPELWDLLCWQEWLELHQCQHRVYRADWIRSKQLLQTKQNNATHCLLCSFQWKIAYVIYTSKKWPLGKVSWNSYTRSYMTRKSHILNNSVQYTPVSQSLVWFLGDHHRLLFHCLATVYFIKRLLCGFIRKIQINNSVALVCKQTIPTERPPLVGEVTANFSG
jgi:hypothetical protein